MSSHITRTAAGGEEKVGAWKDERLGSSSGCVMGRGGGGGGSFFIRELSDPHHHEHWDGLMVHNSDSTSDSSPARLLKLIFKKIKNRRGSESSGFPLFIG